MAVKSLRLASHASGAKTPWASEASLRCMPCFVFCFAFFAPRFATFGMQFGDKKPEAMPCFCFFALLA
jgi:hypothetical protein